MNKRDQLRDEWYRLAGDAMSATLDAMRAHIEENPDMPTLRGIAHDAVTRAREAEARYQQACEEERRQG